MDEREPKPEYMEKALAVHDAWVGSGGMLLTTLVSAFAIALEDAANEAPEKLKVLQLGFASFSDGTFELILQDPETHHETCLVGQMRPEQFEQVDRLLPTCVFVKRAIRAASPSRRAAEDGPWRVGRRVGRNIYFNNHPVCMVESAELAAEMVLVLNAGQKVVAHFRQSSQAQGEGQ